MSEQTVAVPEMKKTIKPPVDIFETSEGIVLVADIPGLAREDLDISVDRGVLTIQGCSSRNGSSHNGHRHGSPSAVFRQFQLGDTIDPDRIAAELKHGVLRLHLPKAEAYRARKVDVKVG